MHRFTTTLLATALLFLPLSSAAQDGDPLDEGASRFTAHAFTDDAGTTLPYRLFTPGDATGDRPLPLILYLHGGAGAGTDNQRQLAGGNRFGSVGWTTDERQATHPTFVVAPQLPGAKPWSGGGRDAMSPHGRAAVALVEHLLDTQAIDPDRVYVTGPSRGGLGSWDLLAKRPDLFAAGAPLCGRGDPARAEAMRNIPIWAFHGDQDGVIDVEGSRAVVEALRALGAPIRYTEYPDVAHDVWSLAYPDPALADWLFAQRRAR